VTSASGEDALDSMKVDENRHVCVSSPVGIWILSPEGKHLGTIAVRNICAKDSQLPPFLPRP
jgi:sugar lactone lactonase YvrE